MRKELAYKRRAVLERNLESQYGGKLCEVKCLDKVYYGRVQTIGVEWEGGRAFTVTLNLDGKRLYNDYDDFKRTTKILRS